MGGCDNALHDVTDALQHIRPNVEHRLVPWQRPTAWDTAEYASLVFLMSGSVSLVRTTLRMSHSLCAGVGTAMQSCVGLLSPHVVTGAAILFALNNWWWAQERERMHWLKRIQLNALELQHAPRWIQANKEVVVAAVLRDPDSVRFAAAELCSEPVLMNALKLKKGPTTPRSQRSPRRSKLPTWLAWCGGS